MGKWIRLVGDVLLFCWIRHHCRSSTTVLYSEFLSFMLVALQKVEQDDIDEITSLFHKLDVTNSNCLTKDDLRVRNENVRRSLMINAPSYLGESFRGLGETNI